MKHTIKHLILTLSLSSLFACQMPNMPHEEQLSSNASTQNSQSSTNQNNTFNTQTLTLEYNKEHKIESEKLALTFTELVQDSRCPINAKCIRAGDVTVKVELKKDKDSLGSGELTLRPDSPDRSDTAKIGDYTLQITKVVPEGLTAGGEEVIDADYSVDVKISKTEEKS